MPIHPLRGLNSSLFSVPSSIIKACVSDNVFNSDFSSKNCYSVADMAITNYYSHKKITSNDITMFSVNKRAKENYICANCKMKFSYFTKKESKSPPSDNPQANNNTNSNNNNNNNSSRSDIIVLKQTLSYPDISDDSLPSNTVQEKPISHSSSQRKNLQTTSLKRHRKEHTNHVAIGKKQKVLLSEPIVAIGKKQKVVLSEPIVPQISPSKTEESAKESAKESKESSHFIPNEIVSKESRVGDNSFETKINNEPIEIDNSVTVKTEREIVEESLDDPEDKPEQLNYDEYRSMPLTLSTLNYVSAIDSDKTGDDFLNRECPKPKKIWMKMIENEDIEKLSIDLPIPSPPVELLQPDKNPPKLVVPQNKVNQHHSNRSYKIKQTLHDKVILTVEKRPEKYKIEQFPMKPLVSDVYTFSEESEILADMQGLVDCFIPRPFIEDDRIAFSTVIDTKTDDSTKSSNSSSSKASRKSKILKTKKILPKSTQQNGPVIKSVQENSIIDSLLKSAPDNSPVCPIIKPVPENGPKAPIFRPAPENGPKAPLIVSVPPVNGPKVSLIKPASENRSELKIEPDSASDGLIDNLFPKSGLVSSAINTCENSSGISFSLNDIVWAKITGYPFWPAKIISFSQQDDGFVGCIEWYAWNEISFIKVNNLFHFLAYYSSKYQKRNRNGKYQEAVKLAKFDCGMLDLPSSKATSEDNENASSSVMGGASSESDSDSNAASCTSVSI